MINYGTYIAVLISLIVSTIVFLGYVEMDIHYIKDKFFKKTILYFCSTTPIFFIRSIAIMGWQRTLFFSYSLITVGIVTIILNYLENKGKIPEILPNIKNQTQKQTISTSSHKDSGQRKRAVQHVIKFIKKFDKENIFGNFEIENEFCELFFYSQSKEILCKSKKIYNFSRPFLSITNKTLAMRSNDPTQNHINFLRSVHSIDDAFDTICINFTESTDYKDICVLLGEKYIQYEEFQVPVSAYEKQELLKESEKIKKQEEEQRQKEIEQKMEKSRLRKEKEYLNLIEQANKIDKKATETKKDDNPPPDESGRILDI